MAVTCTSGLIGENGFSCSSISVSDPSRFITDQLVPLAFATVIFALAIFILCGAFTIIYHHVKLAEWRLGDDDGADDEKSEVDHASA